MPPDSKQAFKAEWEALEVTDHTWALRNIGITALRRNKLYNAVYFWPV